MRLSMNRLRMGAAAAACLGGCLLFASPALSQGPPGGPPGGFGRGPGGGRGGRGMSLAMIPVQALDAMAHLNPAQRAKITQIHEAFRKQFAGMRPQPGAPPNPAMFQQMRDANQKANQQIEALLTPPQKAKLQAARGELRIYRLAGIPVGLYGRIHLTAAQHAKLQQLAQSMPGPGGPGGPGGPRMGGPPMGGPRGPRMGGPGGPGGPPGIFGGPGGFGAMMAARQQAQAVLTPAQKAQIEQYLKAHPEERPPGPYSALCSVLGRATEKAVSSHRNLKWREPWLRGCAVILQEVPVGTDPTTTYSVRRFGTMAQNNPQNTALARRKDAGMTRWTPWDEFASLRSQMDDLFTRAFGYTPLSQMIPSELSAMEPDIDIHETEDKVFVHASLPGYTRDQINVEATNDTLTISGERQPLFQNEKATRHGAGRVTGTARFNATYTLPSEIDPNQITATFRNGVLELQIPKSERARSKTVKVNVQGGK